MHGVIHESKAVQIHIHNNHRCLYVPRVPGSVKNPHNDNKTNSRRCLYVTQLPGSVKNQHLFFCCCWFGFIDYFTYFETIVNQRWAKTGVTGEKPPDLPLQNLVSQDLGSNHSGNSPSD